MLDVLCVGDSVVDIFLIIPDSNPNFDIDKEKNKLLINMGGKINVDKYYLDIGGNATNTAVGISRLGLSVGLCSEMGKDEFSQKILDKLRNEKVKSDYVLQSENEKTSFSIVISYKGERTLFSEHIQRTHDFNFENLQTKLVYLTSLGNFWEDAYKKTLNYVLENKIKLAFNPGTLQLEKKDMLIMDIVEKTDYLFLNKEEAEMLLYGKGLGVEAGDKNESLIKKLMYGLKSLGARNVIITDSVNGSFVFDENQNFYKTKAPEVEVLEKTGAGDAYTAGFISAILRGINIKDAMLWGTANASSVIQKIGAEEGLLTVGEIEKTLRGLEIKTEEF